MKVSRITAAARKSFLFTLAICFIVYAFSSVFGGLVYLAWNDLENLSVVSVWLYVVNFVVVFFILELMGGPYDGT